jgi:hypothetical protein
MKTWLETRLNQLPANQRARVLGALSIFGGILAAVMLHYLLYRIELPSRPFIYVAF